MLLRAVQNSMNKAEEAQKQVLREQHITRSVAVEHLLTNYLTKRDLITHIEQILAAPEFTDSDKIAAVQKLILSQQQTTEQTKKGEEVVTLLQRAYGKKR